MPPMTSDDFKVSTRWFSERTRMEMNMCRWGTYGQPVLVFPTAGGDCEEIERFLMIKVLGPLLEAGRIKVYSVDSVAAAVWGDTEMHWRHKTWLQNQFAGYVCREVVPAILNDCDGFDGGVIVAGASIGAFNSMASICRFPELFRAAVCMSGTYDVERFVKGMDGRSDENFYFSSPRHWLPNLDGGPQLAKLRERFILMAHGGGQWEDPDQDWIMAKILGAKGVPNRVDPWGADYDHDWPTWRTMLPKYLDELTR